MRQKQPAELLPKGGQFLHPFTGRFKTTCGSVPITVDLLMTIPTNIGHHIIRRVVKFKYTKIVPWAMTLAAVFAVAMACSSSPNIESPNIEPTEHPGQGTFTATCAVCHGVEGEGQPDWHIRNSDGTLPAPPLNGDGHTWHHADGLLYRIVSQGGQLWEDPSLPQFKSGMPAFGEQLSHEEIIAVIEYVKSLWADKEIRGVSIVEHQALMSETDPFPSADS